MNIHLFRLNDKLTKKLIDLITFSPRSFLVPNTNTLENRTDVISGMIDSNNGSYGIILTFLSTNSELIYGNNKWCFYLHLII